MASRRLKAIIAAEDRASPVFQRIGAQLKTLGTVAAAVGAVQFGRVLVRGMQASIAAAAQQEKAEAGLAQALRNTGQTVSTVLPQLRDYASSLQDLTGIGDEVILQNQSMLVSIGRLEGQGLRRATQAALDLAAAQQIDVKTAFELISKAAAGYTGTLARYGIIVDQTLTQEQKFSAALDTIEQQFGGSAAAALDTYSGRMAELQGRVGDLAEAIGGPLSQVIEAITRDVVSPFIKQLNDAVSTSDQFKATVVNAGIALTYFGQALEPVIAGLIKFLSIAARLTLQKFLTDLQLLNQTLEGLGLTSEDAASKWVTARQALLDLLAAPPGSDEGKPPAAKAIDEVSASLRELEALIAQLTSAEVPLEEIVPTGIQPVVRGFKTAQEQAREIQLEMRLAAYETTEELAAEVVEQTQTVATASQGFQQAASSALSDLILEHRDAGDVVEDIWRQVGQAIIKFWIQQVAQKMAASTAAASGAAAGSAFGPWGALVGLGIGIVGGLFQDGGIVPAINGPSGGVPIIAHPGEAVLPRELTEMLMRQAGQGGQPAAVNITIAGDVVDPQGWFERNHRALGRAIARASVMGTA